MIFVPKNHQGEIPLERNVRNNGDRKDRMKFLECKCNISKFERAIIYSKI